MLVDGDLPPTTGSPGADASVLRRCLDPRSGLQALLDALAGSWYRTVWPVVRDCVMVYDDLTDEAQMRLGHTVEQAPGRWRLSRDPDEAQRFSWTPGAESWKRYVFPARSEVLRIRRADGSWVTTGPRAADRPLALIGAPNRRGPDRWPPNARTAGTRPPARRP